LFSGRFVFFPQPKPGRFGDRRSVRLGFVTRRDYAGRRRETTLKDFCLETGEDALSCVIGDQQHICVNSRNSCLLAIKAGCRLSVERFEFDTSPLIPLPVRGGEEIHVTRRPNNPLTAAHDSALLRTGWLGEPVDERD
jgi:hypothetical protein